MPWRRWAATVLLTVVLTATNSLNSSAADFTWDGGGANNNWSTTENWNPDGTPATDGTASLLFTGLIRPSPVNDFAALTSFTDLSFDALAGAFTLTGNSIALSGNISDSTASTTQAVNLALALSSAAHTIHVANTGTLAIGGALSGAGASVTKTGFGTLTLSGANSYSGATTVKNGALVLNFANGAAPTSDILYSGVGGPRNLTLGSTTVPSAGDNGLMSYAALRVTGSSAGSATPVTQTFNSTTFGTGVSRVEVTKGTDPGSTTTVELGTLNHTLGGTTYFLLPTKSVGSTSATSLADPGIFVTPTLTATAGVARTTSTNSNGTTGAANGILGGWAYIADTLIGLPAGNSSGSFEVSPGSGVLAATEFASVDSSGNIVPFTGYTNLGPLNNTTSNLKIVSNPNSVINFKVIYSDQRATAQFLANTIAGGQITVLFAPTTDTSQIQVGQFFSGIGLIPNGAANEPLLWSTVAAIDSPTQIRLQPAGTSATSGATGLGAWSVYSPNVQQLEMAATGLTDVDSIRIGEGTGRSIKIGTGNTLRLSKSGAIFKDGYSIQSLITLIGTQAIVTPNPRPGTGIQDEGTLTAGGPDVGGVAQAGELVLNLNVPIQSNGNFSIDSRITDNPGDDNNPNTGGPNGAVTLIKSGSSPLKLRAHNTYSGGTYILGGRVQIAGAESVNSAGGPGTGNPGGFGTGPVYILSGGTWFSSGIGAGVNFTNNLFLAGIGTTAEQFGAIRMGDGNYVGTFTLIGDTRLAGGAANTIIMGQITGGFDLEFGATATVNTQIRLANTSTTTPNNWTGDTTIRGRNGGTGIVNLDANEQIPNGVGFGNLIMRGGNNLTNDAILDLKGRTETVNGLIGTTNADRIKIENRQNGTTATLIVGDASASSTFNGTIRDNNGAGGATGTVALTKIGDGTLALSGVNSYSGATIVKNGVLALDFANPVAPTSQILYAGVGGGRHLTLGSTTVPSTGDNGLYSYAALRVTGSSAGSATPVTQTFDSTTFGKGISRVEVTKGTDPGSTTTVDLGTLTHTLGGATYFLLPTKSVGSVSRTDPGIFTVPTLTVTAGTVRTTSTNSNGTTGAANGILGGWAFISDTLVGLPGGTSTGSFESTNGAVATAPVSTGNLIATEFASVDSSGNIVPFTGYTNLGPLNNTTSNLKIASNPDSVINFKVVYSDQRATAQFLANTIAGGQITVLFATGTDTSQISVGQYFSGEGLILNISVNEGLIWSTVAAIDSPTQIRLQPSSSMATSPLSMHGAWSVYSPNVQQLEMAAAGLTDINSIRMGEGTGRSVKIGTGNTLRLGKSGAIFKDGYSVRNVVTLIGTQATPLGLFPIPGTGIQDDGTLTAGGPDVGGVAQAGELVFNINAPAQTGSRFNVDARITDNPGNDNDPNTGGPNGAVTLIKSGTGPLTLRGHNTYSGGTYILAGRVQLDGSLSRSVGGSGTANPNGFGTGPVTILPGGQWFASNLGSGANFTNNLFIAGNGTTAEPLGAIRMAEGNYLGTFTLIGDTRLAGGSGGGSTIIMGQITGGYDLEFGAPATVNTQIRLANTSTNTPNNWTGDTTIRGRDGAFAFGVISLDANEQIPNGVGFGNLILRGGDNLSNDATLDLKGRTETINGLIGTTNADRIKIENRQNGTTGTLIVGDADASSTFNGTIRDNNGGTGKVALTKIGAGTLRGGGTLSHTGATTINSGTLQLDATQSLKKLKLDGATASLSLNAATSSAKSFEVTSSGGNVNHATNAFSVVGGSGETITWGSGAQLHVQGAAGGKLVLNAAAGTAVSVADNTAKITVEPGATLELAGSVSATRSGANFVNIENNSTTSLHVTGTNQEVGDIVGTGNTTVNADQSLTAGRIVQNNLTIHGDNSHTDALITIRRSGTPSPNPQGLDSKVSVLNSLSLDSDEAPIDPPPSGGYAAAERQYFGTLDLMNNDLIIRNGSPALFAQIQDMIRAAGFGVGGITSGEAIFTGDYAGFTWMGSIYNGFDDDSDSMTPDVPIFTDFDGVSLVGGEIIVKYTWFGDANLDGLVDGLDTGLLSAGFSGADPINQAKNPWLFGDFDYNGIVEGIDSGLVSAGFFGGGDTLHLPEPGSFLLMAVAAVLLAPRARRHVVKKKRLRATLTQTADSA